MWVLVIQKHMQQMTCYRLRKIAAVKHFCDSCSGMMDRAAVAGAVAYAPFEFISHVSESGKTALDCFALDVHEVDLNFH